MILELCLLLSNLKYINFIIRGLNILDIYSINVSLQKEELDEVDWNSNYCILNLDSKVKGSFSIILHN